MELCSLVNPSTDHYNTTLHWELDKQALPAKRKVSNRVSSPWFSLVSKELLQAKRCRHQAERQWCPCGLIVHKELYKKAKHCVIRIVMKAKSLFYNCKISSAYSTKELYSITNNLLAKTKSTPLLASFLLPDLPGLFSTFFRDKIITQAWPWFSACMHQFSTPNKSIWRHSALHLHACFWVCR